MKILQLLNESKTPNLDLHDFRKKLEQKLQFVLNLRKTNQWKELNRYELEYNLITDLVRASHRFKEKLNGQSKIVDQFLSTFTLETIEMIRDIPGLKIE